MEKIMLAQGNGGAESNELINKVFRKYLGKFFVSLDEDAGIFESNNITYASSTDSYIISPIFFPGGDIGKLSICGSSNDVAMMGAKPKYINIGFMIEEGFEIKSLEKILTSMSKELEYTDIKILSADTKIAPYSSMDKIFINTTAIGEVQKQNISAKNLEVNDDIIISGDIGRHGGVIFCARNEIGLSSSLQSDCKQLYPMLEKIFESEIPIHSLRDATRGGIASVLNEWANASKVDIELDEKSILILKEVSGICEILGLEPYSLANEGLCLFGVSKKYTKEVLEILHSHVDGKNACIIGEVKQSSLKPKVILAHPYGGKRYLDYPQGEILPRIC